jgi:hypothetical protein
MKRNIIQWCMLMAAFLFSISCEKDFDIRLKPNRPLLIVEAYINNKLPLYTYVILSRSRDYFSPGFENTPVGKARVTITEGRLNGNTYEWFPGTRKRLVEARIPVIDTAILPGVYFDLDLITNPGKALLGKPGSYYLLEIETDGKQYSAVTRMQEPLPLDSVTAGDHFTDEDKGVSIRIARITAHWKDPDTIGNTQMYYWRVGNMSSLGWGGLGAGRYMIGTDDLVNGQYIHLTHNNGFGLGDTVTYYLVNVERKVYNFWDSFNKARTSAGPFTTPATIQSTISGEDVLGCFSGFSISSKKVFIQ